MSGSLKAQSAQLLVTPHDALLDEGVEVRAIGLPPREGVTIRAETTDDLGRAWRSEAKFEASPDGSVDLSRQPPTSGSYASVDAAGLLWSMSLEPGAQPARPELFTKDGTDPLRIVLTVDCSGRRVATVECVRRLLSESATEAVINESGLMAKLFRPSSPSQCPGVIVLGGYGGGFKWCEAVAALLASRGYATLALAFFGASGLPPTLQNIPLEYFERAIAWFCSQQFLAHGTIGLIGASKGAELALLLASRHEQIGAVVALRGSAFVHQALGVDLVRTLRGQAAWTLGGEPLPYLRCRVRAGTALRLLSDLVARRPTSFAPLYTAELNDPERCEAAAIPVESIRGAVLLVSGSDDPVLPARQLHDLVLRRLERYRHGYPHEHLCYAGAGHLSQLPNLPTVIDSVRRGLLRFSFGGDPKGNAIAQRESWRRMVAFLGDALAP